MSSQATQTAPVRPSRTSLFLHWVGDLLVCIAVAIPLCIPTLALFDNVPRPSPREDRWRFDNMPEGDSALLGWAASQKDLWNFRAERPPSAGQLVLLYERDETQGPARPDWESLGYRGAYLISSDTSSPKRADQPPAFAVLVSALAATLGVAVVTDYRLRYSYRSGMHLIRLTDRPQSGWWK